MDISHRILVVCEDAIMLERLGKYLNEEQGFEARCAGSAHEAIAIAQDWSVELVISDSRLPDMRGLELSDAIRKINPRTRFILITPPGETPEYTHAASNRIVAFLGKPFNPEDLMHFVFGSFNVNDGQFNRREYSRRSFSLEAHLALINPFDDSESRPVASLMRDVSRSGLTMIVRQVIPVPSMLRITFHLPSQQTTIPMLAKSMSCTLTQINGVYRLGAKFIGLLPRELEKNFVKLSRDALGIGSHRKDIFMGKSFKEAALEWINKHKDTIAPGEMEFTQRMMADIAHEFGRPTPEDDE